MFLLITNAVTITPLPRATILLIIILMVLLVAVVVLVGGENVFSV